MAVTATITEHTTTATKYAGVCHQMWDAKSSTLGTGNQEDHRCRWRIKSYPEAWSYQSVKDPRSGGQNRTPVSVAEWVEGWVASIFPDAAGDYTVEFEITDYAGNVSIAEDTVTITAQSGFTTIDCTSSAELATAFTTITSGGGTNYIINLAGDTTYDISSRLVDQLTNVVFQWDGSGASKPVLDFSTNTSNDGFIYPTAGSENVGFIGLKWIDSSMENTDTADQTPVNLFSSGTLSKDVFVVECETDDKYSLESAFAAQNYGVDILFWNNTFASASAVSGLLVFTDNDLVVIGGFYGNVLGERPFRTGNGSLTMISVDVQTPEKDAIRLSGSSDFDTIYRCRARTIDSVTVGSTTTGPDNAVMCGLNNSTNGSLRIIRSELRADASDARPMGAYAEGANGTPVTARGTFISGCILATSGSSNLEGTIENNANGQRLKILNCTIIANSDSSNEQVARLQATDEVVVEGCVILYDGPTPLSASNDRLVSMHALDESTMDVLSFKDNVIDVGLNVNGTKYRYNGANYNLTNLEAAATGISGNVEATVTLDADSLPDSTTSKSIPAGSFEDYYGSSLTPGEPGVVGAVHASPPEPEGETFYIRSGVTNGNGSISAPYSTVANMLAGIGGPLRASDQIYIDTETNGMLLESLTHTGLKGNWSPWPGTSMVRIANAIEVDMSTAHDIGGGSAFDTYRSAVALAAEPMTVVEDWDTRTNSEGNRYGFIPENTTSLADLRNTRSWWFSGSNTLLLSVPDGETGGSKIYYAGLAGDTWRLTDASDLTLNNFSFELATEPGSGNAYGIRFLGDCTNVTLNNCEFDGCQYHSAGSIGDTTVGFVLNNCIFRTAKAGNDSHFVVYSQSATTPISGVVLDGCRFYLVPWLDYDGNPFETTGGIKGIAAHHDTSAAPTAVGGIVIRNCESIYNDDNPTQASFDFAFAANDTNHPNPTDEDDPADYGIQVIDSTWRGQGSNIGGGSSSQVHIIFDRCAFQIPGSQINGGLPSSGHITATCGANSNTTLKMRACTVSGDVLDTASRGLIAPWANGARVILENTTVMLIGTYASAVCIFSTASSAGLLRMKGCIFASDDDVNLIRGQMNLSTALDADANWYSTSLSSTMSAFNSVSRATWESTWDTNGKYDAAPTFTSNTALEPAATSRTENIDKPTGPKGINKRKYNRTYGAWQYGSVGSGFGTPTHRVIAYDLFK